MGGKIFHYLNIRALKAYSLLFSQMLSSPFSVLVWQAANSVRPPSSYVLFVLVAWSSSRDALEYCDQK